jgi:chromosome segregation ATPase
MTISSKEKQKESYNKQLLEINNQLTKLQTQLEEKINPSFHAKNNELISQMTIANNMKNRIDSLYGKQGRSKQFKTVNERNRFLAEQITKLKEQLKKKESSLSSITKSHSEDEDNMKKERNALEKLEKEQSNNSSELKRINHSINEKSTLRNSLQEKRKNNVRELEGLSEQLHEAKNELEKGKQQLNRSLPSHIAQGISAIEYIVQEKGIKG